MKALLYKEFKLAMHPIIYLFVFLFPLMTLIPSYPLAVGFIYIMTAYPILFLGANKGQQSNDLLYTTLLPVRKKDIVKARIFTVAIIQFTYIAIISCLYPAIAHIQAGIIGFAIADLIFFPIYYKKGKSIVMSTLFTIIGFVVYIFLFTVVFPLIPGFGAYKWGLSYAGVIYQLIFLAGALVLYVLIHYLVYKISSKRLEKVDF